MADDLNALTRKLDNVIDSFTDRVNSQTMHKLGQAAKNDAMQELRRELGDTSMSHWRRGRPINLTVGYEFAEGGIVVQPNRRAAGPWKVLEQGRQAGISRGRRGRKGRRYGSSQGKRTWTDATEVMKREVPRRVDQAFQEVLRKQFGG